MHRPEKAGGNLAPGSKPAWRASPAIRRQTRVAERLQHVSQKLCLCLCCSRTQIHAHERNKTHTGREGTAYDRLRGEEEEEEEEEEQHQQTAEGFVLSRSIALPLSRCSLVLSLSRSLALSLKSRHTPTNHLHTPACIDVIKSSCYIPQLEGGGGGILLRDGAS